MRPELLDPSGVQGAQLLRTPSSQRSHNHAVVLKSFSHRIGAKKRELLFDASESDSEDGLVYVLSMGGIWWGKAKQHRKKKELRFSQKS